MDCSRREAAGSRRGRIRSTTVLCVRRNGKVVMAGDGQVTLGDGIVKHSAKKIRRLYNDKILAGFAGSTADAFSLFSRFETKLEQYQGNLGRAAVELAELGVGPEGAIATADKLRRHADGSARAFVELFTKEVWRPFDEAGRPERDWPKIREALERMRPLASGAVLAMFQIAMNEAIEKASESGHHTARTTTTSTVTAAMMASATSHFLWLV